MERWLIRALSFRCFRCNVPILPYEPAVVERIQIKPATYELVKICEACSQPQHHYKFGNAQKVGRIIYSDTAYGRIAIYSTKIRIEPMPEVPTFDTKGWCFDKVGVDELIPLNKPAVQLKAYWIMIGVQEIEIIIAESEKGRR